MEGLKEIATIGANAILKGGEALRAEHKSTRLELHASGQELTTKKNMDLAEGNIDPTCRPREPWWVLIITITSSHQDVTRAQGLHTMVFTMSRSGEC
jgi:hypothetical protein